MWLRCEKCGSDMPEQWVNNWICPECKHDVLWEVDHCDLCDKCYDNEGEDDNPLFSGICQNCLTSLIEEDFDLCYLYLNKDKQIQIDFFIGYQFNTTADLTTENTDWDLIELCKQNFNDSQKIGLNFRYGCHQDMKDFIEFNLDDFAEWYVDVYSRPEPEVKGQYCGDVDREPRDLVEEEE